MWGQCVTIYHGRKMTLTVSQGKLLRRGSHLDQYTMNFFSWQKKKSNYTTETSQSIPSQANRVHYRGMRVWSCQPSPKSNPLNPNEACFSVMLIVSFLCYFKFPLLLPEKAVPSVCFLFSW